MIPLIVACHGRFADELVKSAAMVYGEAESVHAVTFMPGEGPDDLLRKYEEIVAAEGSPDHRRGRAPRDVQLGGRLHAAVVVGVA